MILRDGKTIVFTEVKLQNGMDFGDLFEVVTPRKQGRIRHMAEQYLAEKG